MNKTVTTVNLEIRYYAVIREITSKREEKIVLQKPATIGEIIRKIDEKYGGKIGKIILNEKGELKSNYIILLNGVNIKNMDGLQTKIEKNSEIAIFPPFSGGKNDSINALFPSC